MEALKRIEHDEVCQASRSDAPSVAQVHAYCRRRCGCDDGRGRVEAIRDCLAHDPCKVIVLELVCHHIVGHEAPEPCELGVRCQIRNAFLCHGLELHLDEHAHLEALAHALGRLLAMVRVDAGIEDARKVEAQKCRHMPLDDGHRAGCFGRLHDTCGTGLGFGDDRTAIHDLTEAAHAGILHKERDVFRGDSSAGILEICRGNGARCPEEDLGMFRIVCRRKPDELLDALRAEDIGNLMGLRDAGRGAMLQGGLEEHRRRDHRAFDMHMDIDESRNDPASGKVCDLLGLDLLQDFLICAGIEDPAIQDCDRSGAEAAEGAVEDLCALQQKICLHR